MSNELSTEISPEIINSLILTGDMSKLTASQQTQYYGAVCKSVGINPITQPFAIITLQGKKTLYATKGCTQQLADSRGINTEVKERKTADSVYVVSVRATMEDGRFTDEDGIVSVVGLKGVELANAMMKAVTKAKRRAVLALCGLGIPDETEIEDTPHAASEPTTGKSRVEALVENQAEEAQITKPEVKDPPKEDIEPKKNNLKQKKQKETVKNDDIKSDPKSTDGEPLPDGIKSVTGILAWTNNAHEIPAFGSDIPHYKTGVKGPKWVVKIEGLKYGTFDKTVADEIMNVIDIGNKSGTPILVNIQYTERPAEKAGVLHRDIVKFSQVTAE